MMSSTVENIKLELDELGCNQLMRLQSVSPFQQPNAHYFESNLSLIEEKDLLFPYSKETVFDVPLHYFDDLSANVMDIVLDGQEDQAYDFEVEKIKMPFALPENYFEQLRPEFVDKEIRFEQEKSTAKVVSFFRNLNKYVAAAVILVLFSVGANIMLHVKEERNAYQMLHNMNINNELADVPTEEIFNYLNESASKNMDYLINHPDGSNLINKVLLQDRDKQRSSDDEVLQFLSDEDHGF